jgi:hypothetical protein
MGNTLECGFIPCDSHHNMSHEETKAKIDSLDQRLENGDKRLTELGKQIETLIKTIEQQKPTPVVEAVPEPKVEAKDIAPESKSVDMNELLSLLATVIKEKQKTDHQSGCHQDHQKGAPCQIIQACPENSVASVSDATPKTSTGELEKVVIGSHKKDNEGSK